MNLTVEALKHLAAGAVAEFNCKGTPLNEGIMKIASENQFNPEQIKRLVEASNQIAYLSKMAEASDKTFEFKVADYDEIIDSFLTVDPMLKQASHSGKRSPMDIATSDINCGMEKKASVEHSVGDLFSENDRLHMIEKQFHAGRATLDDMNIKSHDYLEDLLIKSANLRRDPEALDKIAQWCGGSSDKFNEISRLVFGHVKEASSFNTRNLNVLSVKSLHDTLMMAKEANDKRAALQNSLEKAAEVLSEKVWGITKEAGLMTFMLKHAPKIGTRLQNASRMAKSGIESVNNKITPGVKTIGKGVGAGVGTVFGATEVAQISAGSRPKNDVWKSLHG